MPSYRAKTDGFWNGELYGPTRKRTVVDVDTPFKKDKQPSWLELVEESSTQTRSRTARTAAQKKADADKKAADKKETDAVNFLDENKPTAPTQPGVTTL